MPERGVCGVTGAARSRPKLAVTPVRHQRLSVLPHLKRFGAVPTSWSERAPESRKSSRSESSTDPHFCLEASWHFRTKRRFACLRNVKSKLPPCRGWYLGVPLPERAPACRARYASSLFLRMSTSSNTQAGTARYHDFMFTARRSGNASCPNGATRTASVSGRGSARGRTRWRVRPSISAVARHVRAFVRLRPKDHIPLRATTEPASGALQSLSVILGPARAKWRSGYRRECVSGSAGIPARPHPRG